MSSSSVSQGKRVIPSDKIRLDILLTTGQRAFYDFHESECVADVKQKIWHNWPSDWPPRPPQQSSLRLLHLGLFLDDSAPLGSSQPTIDVSTTSDTKNINTTTTDYPSTSKKSKSANKNERPAEKRKTNANSDLQANVNSAQPRNFPLGNKTVLHLLVQGGFADSNQPNQENEQECDKDEEVEKVHVQNNSPTSRSNRQEQNDAGCCCVIC
ncbi:unnamed protein product [Sympodiomycopsis kandeliae]